MESTEKLLQHLEAHPEEWRQFWPLESKHAGHRLGTTVQVLAARPPRAAAELQDVQDWLEITPEHATWLLDPARTCAEATAFLRGRLAGGGSGLQNLRRAVGDLSGALSGYSPIGESRKAAHSN